MGKHRKENFMDEDMNVGELLKETAEDKERVKALLNK